MLKDSTKGILSYDTKKFYYLETGDLVYFGNPIPRLKQTLLMRNIVKIDDFSSKQAEILEWKEAKLKNAETEAIFLSQHIKKLVESKVSEPEKPIWS